MGMRPDVLEMAFGHPNDAPRPIWGRPRQPKSAQKPSKSAPKPPQRRSKSSRRGFGTCFSHEIGKQACRKARGMKCVPFCVFRVLSRDGPDVHETSVLRVFQHDSSMFASHECAHAGASKKQPFRLRKSSRGAPKPLLGASGRAKIEPKRPCSSEKVRSECLPGL